MTLYLIINYVMANNYKKKGFMKLTQVKVSKVTPKPGALDFNMNRHCVLI